MSDNAKLTEQVALAEKLQVLLLQDFVRLAEEGALSPTDRATLARLLSANNWSLDPTRIPQDLQDKLTSRLRFDQDLDQEV